MSTVDTYSDPHATDGAAPTTPPPTAARRQVRVDRIVVGSLIALAGVGWLADEAGGSVPWAAFPAVALIIIGIGLLATLLGGVGRGALVVLGVVALAFGVAVGVGASRYAGPVGDETVAPATDEWPVTARISAGTMTVDLTRYPLPESGVLLAEVGAGRIVVTLPADADLSIDARATVGTVRVDGGKVGDGIDVHWSSAADRTTHVELTLQVGMGDIEVNHETR